LADFGWEPKSSPVQLVKRLICKACGQQERTRGTLSLAAERLPVAAFGYRREGGDLCEMHHWNDCKTASHWGFELGVPG
jgi:hypothetical protein